MVSIRALIAVAWLSLMPAIGLAASSDSRKPLSPTKAVKQAEKKLKRLVKEGEDRPSVYEARLELARALRGLQSCEVLDRVDQELAAVVDWLGRLPVPVRLSPQLVFNDIGRAAQARAQCTEDEAQHKAHHEAALRAFERAAQAARSDHDALNEAITLFNAAASAEALGDLPRAIELMESACAIDREFALYDNYREDYPALIRLKDAKAGTATPPEAIEEHLAKLVEDKVRFSFKPMHGERQSYKSEIHELKLAGGERHEERLDVQYSAAVAVQGELVTVSMQPAESVVGGRAAGSVPQQSGEWTPEELLARLLAQPLSYTVKTSGEFVGATGLDEVRRTVLTKIDEAFSGQPATEQRARAKQLAEQLLSDAVINQQIADEWTMAVAWWIDAELDLGDWYTLDVEAPQAALPDVTLKYTYVFKVNRRLACGPADRKKSCVELIIEGSPDREQFADYLIAFTQKVAGPQPRRQMRWYRDRLAEDVQLVERSVLVVEPDTLRTHRQLRSKLSYVAASERGGSPKITLRTVRSELQAPAPDVKRAKARASAKRNAQQAKPN